VTTTALGIDIGGTAIKSGLVASNVGRSVVLNRIATPNPSRPNDILDALSPILDAAKGAAHPVGVAICGHVANGVVHGTNNLSDGWNDFDLRELLARHGTLHATVLNDADAAAYTEAPACSTVERCLFITFGTGVGTALLEHGDVLEGFELAGAEIDGIPVDQFASTRHATGGESWTTWAARADRALATLHDLVRPDVIIVGGGASERWDHWAHVLTLTVPVQRAKLGNEAGVVGAALAAIGSRSVS
jgi:polyphosphate glucokinase